MVIIGTIVLMVFGINIIFVIWSTKLFLFYEFHEGDEVKEQIKKEETPHGKKRKRKRSTNKSTSTYS